MSYLNRTKNPLNFWKQHKNTYFELNMLQLKYLCVPAMSVPLERAFSKTGQITNDCRIRLHPINLDYIVFLNSNINLLILYFVLILILYRFEIFCIMDCGANVFYN
ncbi:zinc finger BED domain-containing protein 1-like [Aphis craccivora]|uniref:Zinc finger BED domain-containing protein 1-like n=1 Tax=Aphis craccivora TaxID=307492 RepID=A0A6G0YVJ6_APHCR|nr:zinc finger BED domain-containing protein 1-like [Aphis craccivora]